MATRTFSSLLLGLVVLFSCGPAELKQETADLLRDEAVQRLAQISGQLEVPGLEKPVEVLRDKWGVAHIYAKSQHDLFFAQGFVAAQDRLYQIEIWRRTGTGELAEVFGSESVERDRMARLVRYRGDMGSEWASYSPDTEAIATAFVGGINAYIEHVGDKLPIEFALLDFEPGKWEAEHCLLRIAGLMMTRNARQELARAEMLSELGPEITEKYFPTDPVRALRPDPRVDLQGIDSQVIETYRRATEIPNLQSQDASNNWVVDGELSATGRPILASDPHRSVNLPSLRYLVHLIAPGWNVIGSGEPALPGVALGHNERVGWGFTIVQYDQVDLYVEQTNPENPNQYLYEDDWLDMETETESINVRGQDPVKVELKFTRHGPIIWEDPKNHRVVAVRWVGMEPGTAGYLGSLAMDRVQDWDGFVAAMSRWKIPAENIVYADIDGDIGWIPAGLMPIRENWLGLLPIPGHTAEYEWSGFRTVDQLPRVKNPPEHFVATSNHNILPCDYPFDLGFDWTPPYRFLRVHEVLAQSRKFTIEDFKRLQHDEISLPARRLVGMLRELPTEGSKDFQTARQILEEWDNSMERDSQAAALYEVWQEETITPEFVAIQLPEEARELVAKNIELPTLFDLIDALPDGTRGQVLSQSLERAFSRTKELLGEDPEAWRWGAIHKAHFTHPLASNEARRTVFNRGPIERGGDAYTPNRTSGGDYIQRHGATYRHILDFANWDNSVFTSAPGQSGQPESPHYDDLASLWANYQYAPLVYSRTAVEANTVNRLILEPVSQQRD
jgi:penicillin amidase